MISSNSTSTHQKKKIEADLPPELENTPHTLWKRKKEKRFLRTRLAGDYVL